MAPGKYCPCFTGGHAAFAASSVLVMTSRTNSSPSSKERKNRIDSPVESQATPPSCSNRSCATIVIMRHGLTDWNREGRVQGGLDQSRLNYIGMRQARNAGEELRFVDFDGVYVSPLSRARSTLEIAIEASGNRRLQERRPETLESLLEIQVPWQGLKKTEIATSMLGEEYSKYLRDPYRFSFNGFSPVGDIMRRANDVWETLRRSCGKCQLVVSHNQMNRALLCSVIGLQGKLSVFRQNNCCFNVVLLTASGEAKVRLINYRPKGAPTQHYLPRRGFFRIVLHKEGGSRGLQLLFPKKRNAKNWGSIYLLDEASGNDMDLLPWLSGPREVSNIGAFSEKLENLCKSATEFLDSIRLSNGNKIVLISSTNSATLSLLLNLVLGIDNDPADRFIFDDGGITVVDVPTSVPIGKGIPFLECHNVGAFSADSRVVLEYTRIRGPSVWGLD